MVILNESLARRLFGAADPLGDAIRLPDRREARVVGVAADSKYVTVGEKNVLAMYEPFAQRGDVHSIDDVAGRNAAVFLRVHGGPGSFRRPVDAALSKPNPANAVEVRTMRDAAEWALLPSRAGAGVFGAAALLGLAIACIGQWWWPEKAHVS